MLAATFGTGQVLYSMLYFFLFFMWIMLLFWVFTDIFRSTDLSGGMKALWVIVVVLFWVFGVLIYLIVRGGKMHERALAAQQEQEKAAQEYIRQAAGTGSTADELSKLAQLKSDGVIDDAEFERQKAKILS